MFPSFYSSNLSGQVIADRNYAPGEQVRCISIGMVFIPLLNNYIMLQKVINVFFLVL